MKLVIVGATGGIGQQLVSLAVKQGHAVTAVVRSRSWVAPTGVTAMVGALTDVDFLAKAFEGNEVVLSALGLRLKSIAPWAKPEVADFLSRSTPAIIAAMKQTGVARVIAVSAGGVGETADKVPGAFKTFVRLSALRHAYAELEVMERLFRQSGLQVCLAQPTGLTDGPVTEQVKVCASFEGRATISRADVAWWMLGEAVTPRFTGQAPMITVTGA
jgi:putative NADH-flavin reductase